MVGVYGRSARFKTPRPATSPRIGPSTYYVSDPPCQRCGSHAPFLTTAPARAPPLPKDRLCVPAPNMYFPDYFPRHIKGGDSVRARAPRGDPLAETGAGDARPGPGDYSPRLPACVIRDAPCDNKECKEVERCTCRPGVLVRARMEAALPGAPSVPSKKQTRGWRPVCGLCRGAERWEPVEPPAPPPPPGPHSYDVRKPEVCEVTLRYKGNFWSRRSGRRTGAFNARGDGPGPAHYSPHARGQSRLAPLQAQMEALRAERRAKAPTLRTADLALRQAIRQNLPSPAAYTACPMRCCFSCHLPPFAQTAPRFARSRKLGPGPADTHDPRTAFDALQRTASRLRPAFSSSAPRALSWGSASPSPGPAAYDTDRGLARAAARAAGRRARSEVALTPFGSRTPRDVCVQLEDPCKPGPALYQTEEKVQKMRAGSASFKSVTKRSFITERKWVPPVGLYEWAAQANALHSPTSHLCRRYARRCPFLRGTPRFPEEPPDLSPGPGSYETRVDSVAGALLGCMDSAPRSRPPPDTPGPAHYHIHRLERDTVVWPTFNRTLCNPVARARPAVPCLPRAQLVAMRKRLRCFVKGEATDILCRC